MSLVAKYLAAKINGATYYLLPRDQMHNLTAVVPEEKQNH